MTAGKNKQVIVFVLAWSLLSFVCVRLLPFAFDDAYIHFRIAENFLRFGSPFFNFNEPVMSTSSPVWTLLLIITKTIISKGSLPNAVAIINAFLTVSGGFIWVRIINELMENEFSPKWQLILGIIYVGIMLPSCAGLMEAPLALLLLGSSIYLIIKKKLAGWVLLVLTLFVRLESVVFFFIFGSAYIFKHPRKAAQFFLITAMTFCVIGAIVYFYFGTILPNTMNAKQIVYNISIITVLKHIYNSLFPQKPLVWGWIIIFLFLATTTLITSRFAKLPDRKHWLWEVSIFSGGSGILMAYIVKHVFVHEWYQPLYIVPILFGGLSLCRLSVFGDEKKYLLFGLLSVKPIIHVLVFLTASFGFMNVLPSAATGARVQRYLQVGSALYHLFPKQTLVTSEIGGLGYSFKGRVEDGVGLVTPSAIKYHPLAVPSQRSSAEIGAIPTGFIEAVRPGIIVSYPIFVEAFDKSDVCRNGYIKFAIPAISPKFSAIIGSDNIWGCTELNIYIRKDIAYPDAMKAMGDWSHHLPGGKVSSKEQIHLKEKRMAGPQRSVCEFPEHGQDGPFQKELKAAGIVSCQGIMNEVADYKIVLRT